MTNGADPDIRLSGVRKYFKDVKAVDGVDLEVAGGEYLALLGPNGAGKTTLVEMIEGIQFPDDGEIRIRGKSWSSNEDELRRILGISLQETYFIDKLTVRETLNLFASFYRLDDSRIRYILELTHLVEKEDVYIVHLSGGQRQKLALGIALLNHAGILLLDEPTTGLDPAARREIWDILLELKKEKKTSLILTTHYMEEASYLCDRIVILDRGKILASGTLEQLLSENKSGEIIEFTLENPPAALDLEGIDGIRASTLDPVIKKGRIIVDNAARQLPAVMQAIEEQNITLLSLECRRMTLEDLFISMTGRHLNP